MDMLFLDSRPQTNREGMIIKHALRRKTFRTTTVFQYSPGEEPPPIPIKDELLRNEELFTTISGILKNTMKEFNASRKKWDGFHNIVVVRGVVLL